MSSRTKAGFTLIELMIVIAIMAILVAIAVPTLLRSRQESQYQTAWYTMRTVQSAENAYWAQNGVFTDFDTLRDGGFLDHRFHGTDSIIQAYEYVLTLGPGNLTFSCVATSGNGDGRTVTLDATGAIT
jgi:prepilin-type N-terminal cleavage/methylation domain-containing protein